MYKSKLNRTVKRAIASFVIVVIAAIILGVVAWVTLESNTSKPEGALYQYFLGVPVEYEDGGKLKFDENSDLVLETDGGDAALDTTPVYYRDEDRFIVSLDMSYVDAALQKEYYVPVLSEFIIEEDRVYFTGYGDQKKQISNGFLYDGVDTYVFLEDSIVYIKGNPIAIGKFSFAKITSKGSYIIYDYAEKELRSGDVGNYEVKMENARGTYDVSLSYDKAVLGDGTERLLFVIPNRLDLLEQ